MLDRIKARLSRGKASEDIAHASPKPVKDGELAQLREQVAQKSQRLKRVRRQLDEKDHELADLRVELAETKDDGSTLPSSSEAPSVFFVLGLAKSGTSWLMKTLDSHPEILCKGEGRFFGRDFRQEHLKSVQVNKQPTSLYNAVLSSEDLRFWIDRSPWSHGDDSDEHLINLTGLATEYFLRKKLAQTSKKIVGDKTPLLTPEFVEEIGSICPQARVIHIIRDGRDSAVSLMHHMWNRSTDQGGIQQLEPEEVEKRRMYREDYQRWLETGEGMFTENRLRRVARNWKLRINKTAKDGTSLFGPRYTEIHEGKTARPGRSFVVLQKRYRRRLDELLHRAR